MWQQLAAEWSSNQVGPLVSHVHPITLSGALCSACRSKADALGQIRLTGTTSVLDKHADQSPAAAQIRLKGMSEDRPDITFNAAEKMRQWTGQHLDTAAEALDCFERSVQNATW